MPRLEGVSFRVRQLYGRMVRSSSSAGTSVVPPGITAAFKFNVASNSMYVGMGF